MFFSVVWKGIRQVLGWFFGLFGYKREGKFARCVWGLFALSATAIVTIAAGALIYHNAYSYYYRHYAWKARLEEGGGRYVSHRIGYINPFDDEDGYLIDKVTGKTVLTGIEWISRPLGDSDSLVVFSNGKKRGYFNMYTGQVEIPAKYDHAWVFSEGIASVEENGVVRFIDTKGNQVFDRTFAYDPEHDGYVFHGGYCVVDEDHDYLFGLMDKKGQMVLKEIYDDIDVSNDLGYWTLRICDQSEVLDKDLNPILPMMPCKVYVFDDEIDVTMPDNTMRKYDLQGNLIDDFYISDFDYLEYDLEETYQIVEKEYDDYGEEHEYVSNTEHKTARARLGKYTAGDGKEGLMTADGHMVTLPKYEYVNAIGPDTYICTVSHGDKEVINGKGEKVK